MKSREREGDKKGKRWGKVGEEMGTNGGRGESRGRDGEGERKRWGKVREKMKSRGRGKEK